MKLICTFTTGRTGTGYLSQLFGGEYSKHAIHQVNRTLITHESWPELKNLIEYVKKNGYSSDDFIKKSFIEKYNELGKEYDFDTYFITDHRVGRYFAPFLIEFDIKIIRITKPNDDIIRSFLERFDKTKTKIPNKYDKFYNNLWTKSFYHPDDKYTLLPIKKYWNEMSDAERLRWYCDETDARWAELKASLNSNIYFEIDFNSLFKERRVEELSDFLNIKFSKKNFKRIANK